MAQYLTQEEYADMAGDASISKAAYERHEFRAQKAIDNLTFGRVKEDTKQRTAVKMLVFELITMYAANEALRLEAHSGKVSAWSNDDVRVDVKQATPMSEKNLDVQADNLICDFLADEYGTQGTPLLYRGLSLCP